MAGKKENIKALFSNTRTRVIILFTAILLVASVGIGLFKIKAANQARVGGSTNVKKAPTGIHSIPGSLNQTAQYATLQNKQNIDQAETANKSGGSAIPTIIKTQAFGEGVDLIGPQYGEGGAGFTTLSRSNLEGASKSLWFQQLQAEHCSHNAIKTIVDKGATLSDLREECNCCQLRQYGYTLSDLHPVCACTELKAAGFTAREMKVAGYSADKLKRCGFSACETRGAGFSVEDMKEAGFTNGELKGAGFSEEDIDAANGLPAGISIDDVRNAGCDPEKLKQLREQGVSAAAVQRISACSLAQLKAAGYTAAELKRAGASAAALKALGFSPEALKEAGYSARDLLNAGFSPEAVENAGFSAEQVEKGKDALPPGVTTSQLRKAGCSVETLKRERRAGVSAKSIRQSAGCDAAALREAGFSDSDLAHAGFTPVALKAIRAAGKDLDKLKALRAAGVSAKQLRDLNGLSAAELKAAGFSAAELAAAGFSPEDLKKAGFSAADLKQAGFSSEELQAAGISPVGDDAVLAAGKDPDKLKALRAAGASAKQLRDLNGLSAAELKALGYSPEDLKKAGFSAAELKAAGLSAKELADAGFTPAELLKAGFDSGALNNAGLIPASVIAAGREKGCKVEELKAARSLGVSAATIRETLGCSADAMKAAGYSAQELKDAGYSAAELKKAGFDAKALKEAGFSAQELKDAGYGVDELVKAGFGTGDLKSAGFSAAELKAAGFDAKALKKAGYDAAALKKAGVSSEELKAAGYSAQDLKDAGLTKAQIKALGLPVSGLKGTDEPGSLDDLSSGATNESSMTRIPSLESTKKGSGKNVKADTRELKDLMARQQSHISDQKYQAKVKQLTGRMASAAGQALQGWKSVSGQVFIAGTDKDDDKGDKNPLLSDDGSPSSKKLAPSENEAEMQPKQTFVKTGDILFAVLDTSVNTDEPGPILATIVSGKLKGSKLIGSFTLPSNSDKMVVTFNTLSMLGADQTISISAYAIDPNTARTALASRVNHHYLMRYGSLFASTFLAGFSSAIQSADTTITIGGTGGTTDTTVQNGINRSLLENALIGLGEVGKAWSETAQELMNRPTTVELFSGTGMGILFTQDVQIA
ncbi:MAG: type IVB secretion system protein DotG/IcmE [Gammaproteobacteria bacterium]|nr:type IVB secretion system protein DotG/IcmE [Gammaproteobacteria bacterium]